METEETRMNVRLSDEIIGDKPALEDFVRFCVEEAVRAEREACAKIAEGIATVYVENSSVGYERGLYVAGTGIAAVIRARKELNG
jgi:hypothetical protein